MTLSYTVRPISDRSAFAGVAHRAHFRASWSGTLQLLERELNELSARQVVLELDVRENQIRVDGLLRADATASSTAVRLAFESRHGSLIYATDRFGYDGWDRPLARGWQENVRAVALGLEALRKVDRYGISRRGEQYRGYKALGAGTGLAPTSMTTEDAVRVLRDASRLPLPATFALNDVLREARRLAHPDHNNGDRAAWNKVDEAEQVLRRAGRLG